MADVHTKETRSYNMSRIKSANTKPELHVRKFLFSKGYRYRLHSKDLPGKPDIVLPRYKTIIFVNGCFWHGHQNCKYFAIPKTKTEWWVNKINGNIINDQQKKEALEDLGWNVITIWECQLKSGTVNKTLSELFSTLQKLNQ